MGQAVCTKAAGLAALDQIILEDGTETNCSIPHLLNCLICLAMVELLNDGFDVMVGRKLQHEFGVPRSSNGIARNGEAVKHKGHNVHVDLFRWYAAKVTKYTCSRLKREDRKQQKKCRNRDNKHQ